MGLIPRYTRPVTALFHYPHTAAPGAKLADALAGACVVSVWPKRKVSEMGFVQGGRQRSPHLTEGRRTPYLRVANVFDGYIDTSDVLEMPFTEAEFARYVLKPNDLLLNEGQSLELVGRCAKYEGDPKLCCFQNTLVRFQAGPECETNYAYQLFRWCQKSGIFAQIATKTNSIAHLGSTRFADLELPFPSLPEQRRIAAILSQWDDSLSILSRLIDAKRQQKRGLAEALLTGRRRILGFEGEWELQPLGKFLRESRIPGSDGASARKLTVKLWGKGVYEKQEKLLGSENTRYFKRRAGQLIFSKLDFLNGAFGIISDNLDGLESTLDLPCFDFQTGLEPRFLLELISREKFYRLFEGGAIGGRKARRVTPEEFLKAEIEIPSLPEQRAIASVLSTLDEELSALERLRTSVQTQKRGLMDLLLTGKVRVKVEEAS